jgi:Domain of unknown function (DUF1937)
MMQEYIYLASPYSHESSDVMDRRYDEALQATAWLMNKGVFVYSPIVHCHELAKRYQLPRDFEYWRDYNFSMLAHAGHVNVLSILGLKTSKGVAGEYYRAKRLGKSITLMEPSPGNKYICSPMNQRLAMALLLPEVEYK